MKRYSIRKRITGFYSVLLLAVILFASVFLFFTADSQLYSISRNSLEKAVKNSVNQLSYSEDQIEINSDFDFYVNGVTLILYGPKGTVMAGSLPSGFPARTPLVNDSCRTIQGASATYLIYDLLITHPQTQSIWVRGICLIDDRLALLQATRRLALFVLPVILLLAVFGGSFLTRRAFEPVEAMFRAAEEISEGNDLSRRITLKGAENELTHLAQAWNRMMERLQRAFENERQFNSDVSHELKTPIAVILSYCEYALDRPRSEEEYRKAFLDIQKQARRMSSLSSQLLELSQNMNAENVLQKEEVDLSLLCESVCEEMEGQAQQRDISIIREIQPDLTALVDEMQWMRLQVNLISNAIRYGNAGGWIRVGLWAEEEKIWLTVADNGEGIPQEDLPFLFERFHKVQHGEGQKEGFGLGLSYVYWIAQAHGGEVSVESRLGEGSKFTVWIPKC